MEPAPAVEVGAGRVEQADDDTWDIETLLRNLGDDDVGVVAAGGDDDGVGVLVPASPSTTRFMPCPWTKPPAQCEPIRSIPYFFSSIAITSQPMMIAFTRSSLAQRSFQLLLEDTLRERDDEHLAGAFRSVYSTVGEKNRDCRRQRGAEPVTIRSAPDSSAAPTIAAPIERGIARTGSRASSAGFETVSIPV